MDRHDTMLVSSGFDKLSAYLTNSYLRNINR